MNNLGRIDQTTSGTAKGSYVEDIAYKSYIYCILADHISFVVEIAVADQ